MHKRFSRLAAPATSLLPALAEAADSATPDLGGSLLQLGFGLALILGLLFATLWLLKKISLPRGAERSMVRVVSAAAVGPRERVVVVDVAGKRLLLGVAPGHVTLLDSLAGPEIPGSSQAIDATPEASEFAHWMQRIKNRYQNRHEK